MNWTYKDQNENQTAIYNPELERAAGFIPKLHPDHDKIRDLFIDTLNTIQQCDKLPSELLSERDDAVRIIREAIDLYENRGVDIPELWIDNAFLFIKQIEHGK